MPLNKEVKRKRKKQKRVYQPKNVRSSNGHCREAKKSHKDQSFFVPWWPEAGTGSSTPYLRLLETNDSEGSLRDLHGLSNRACVEHWIPSRCSAVVEEKHKDKTLNNALRDSKG